MWQSYPFGQEAVHALTAGSIPLRLDIQNTKETAKFHQNKAEQVSRSIGQRWMA